MIPPLPKGRTTVRIIPQRVPPRASAPSFSPGGACENTSRKIAVHRGSDHDRHDEAGDERCPAEQRGFRLEDRDECDMGGQPIADLHQSRLQEEPAPKAVDETGNCRQEINDRRDRPAEPGRGVLGGEQGGAGGERYGDDEGLDGDEHRAEQQRRNAELVRVGIPFRLGEEAPPRRAQRRQRLDQQKGSDERHQNQGRAARQADNAAVDAIAERPPNLDLDPFLGRVVVATLDRSLGQRG